METISFSDDLNRIETLFARAGIPVRVVDSCRQPDCLWCQPELEFPTAA